MRECGIKDNCVKVDVLTNLTFRETLIGVAALFVFLLNAFLHLAISLVAAHFSYVFVLIFLRDFWRYFNLYYK